MKALTIHGPWAWAIAAGHKTIENRSWSVNYRGQLAIHAGSSTKSDREAAQLFARLGLSTPAAWPRSCVVAVVDLIDVRPIEDVPAGDPWACGPFCWVLGNVRPLAEAVACDGALNLWTLPPRIERAVQRQLQTISTSPTPAAEASVGVV